MTSYLYSKSHIPYISGYDVIKWLNEHPDIYDKCLTEDDLKDYVGFDNETLIVYAWKTIKKDKWDDEYVPYMCTWNKKIGEFYLHHSAQNSTVVYKKTSKF